MLKIDPESNTDNIAKIMYCKGKILAGEKKFAESVHNL